MLNIAVYYGIDITYHRTVVFVVVRKRKSIWRRLLESKPHEYRSIKILFLFPLGLFVGIGRLITCPYCVYHKQFACVTVVVFGYL